jgi:hypothetical protein
VGFARSTRALRDATRRLAEAEAAFAASRSERGFASLHAAVFGYFADKTNVTPASLTSDAIDALLRARDIEAPLVDGVRRVVAACDAARYAAAAAPLEQGRALARAARECLASIEKAWS